MINYIGKNSGWYFAMILMVVGFVCLFFFQRSKSTQLIETGLNTVGHFQYQESSLLDFKQEKKGIWSYTIDGARYEKLKTIPFQINTNEYYTVYYDSKNKEDIEIAYDQFVLIGTFKNTEAIETNRSWLNSNVIDFKYKVKDTEYTRSQYLKSEMAVNPKKKYLVKYKVGSPQTAYIFVDSIK